MPEGWFGPETWPLLAQFGYHAVQAGRLARMIEACDPDRDLDHYAKLLGLQRDQTSALEALGSSLRISPQGRPAAERGACLREQPRRAAVGSRHLTKRP